MMTEDYDKDLRDFIHTVVAEYLQDLRQSSCELGRNASGATTIAIKEYAPSVADAYTLAEAVYKQACEEYPFVPQVKP